MTGLLLLPGCILVGDDLSLPDLDHASTRAADLIGPSWIMIRAVSDDGEQLVVEGDTLFTLAFRPDGSLGGRAGYNTHFGEYAAGDNGTILVGRIGSTRVYNPPEYRPLETVLMEGLTGARAFRVADPYLHLYYGSRGVLRFEKAG